MNLYLWCDINMRSWEWTRKLSLIVLCRCVESVRGQFSWLYFCQLGTSEGYLWSESHSWENNSVRLACWKRCGAFSWKTTDMGWACSATVGNVIPGHVVLSCITNQAEQVQERKSVSSTPPQLLLWLLPPGRTSVSTLTSFSGPWELCGEVNLFLPMFLGSCLSQQQKLSYAIHPLDYPTHHISRMSE